METNNELTVLGRRIPLTPRPEERLDALTIGEKLSYTFYDGFYAGVPMLFVEPKNGNPTPKECDITGRRLDAAMGLPVVFILNPGPMYERQRLVDKGVYFIMSDKFAYLPMLAALEKVTDRQMPTVLTPVAQYLLLYHLQVQGVEGLTPQEIAPLLPYSYESTTLAITCLTDLGLCEKVDCGTKGKAVHFELKGKFLWEASQPYLQSPVEHRIYCDGIHTDTKYPLCGVKALAHYTKLNPVRECMLLIPLKEYRSYKIHDALDNPNIYDGDIMVEVWKYPAVAENGIVPCWADRLSLALSLREDSDPRVENEVERLIAEMVWKG